MGRRWLIAWGALLLLAPRAEASPTRIYLRMSGSILSTSTVAPTEAANVPACTSGCVTVPVCAICISECPPIEEQISPPASAATITVKFVVPEAWGKDPAMNDAHFRYSANKDVSKLESGFARPKMQIRYEPLGGAQITERFHAGCYQCSQGGCELDGAGPVTFDDQIGPPVLLTTDEVSPTGLPSTMPAGSTIWIDLWSSDGDATGIVYASSSLPTWVEIPYAKDNFAVKGRISPSYLTAESTTTFAFYLDNTDVTGPAITKLELDIPAGLAGTLFVDAVSVLSVVAPVAYTTAVTQATPTVAGKLTVNFTTPLTSGMTATVFFSAVTPVAPVQNMLWGGQVFSGVQVTVAELSTDALYTAVLPVPQAPTGLAATAQSTAGAGGHVQVTWNHPGPAAAQAITAYLVFRGSSAATATTWIASVPPSGVAGTGSPGWRPGLTIVTQTSALRLDDLGLPNGVLACYTVMAANPVGACVPVAAMCATPYQDPRQVTSLTALTRSGAVELAWEPAVPGTYALAGYELRRATCAACAITSSVFIVSATASTYVDTTVANGATYRYEVRAYDTAGHNGALSPTATGAPSANPPGGLTIRYDANVTGVALQWSPATGNVYALSGYVVYRATCATCTPVPSATVWVSPATTVFVDASVATGQLFFYSVATRTDEAGLTTGPRSAALRILIPPAVPYGLTVLTQAPTTLRVQWSDTSYGVGQVSFFRTYRATVGTATVFTTPIHTNSVSWYVDSGLAAGMRYYYRVTAYLISGPDTAESAPSPVVSQVMAPSTPAGLVGEPQDSLIRLSWTDLQPAQEVQQYLLYRTTGVPGGATIFLAAVTGSVYDDTTVTNGVSYTYRIAARNAGGVSATSAESAAYAPYRPPQAPGWLTAVSGPGGVTLLWGPAPTTTWPLDRYELWFGTAPGAMSFYGPVPSTDTSAPIGSLVDGTAYVFKLQAVDVANYAGPFGNLAWATPAFPPCPPAGLTAGVTAGQVDLAWTVANGAACSPPSTLPVSGYRVYRSTYSGGGRTVLWTAVGQNATSYSDATVVIGITYYYAVRSFDTGLPPNESVSPFPPYDPAYSPEIAATPRVAAGAPGGLTILPGQLIEHDTKLRLAWAPSSTGTFQVIGYDVYRSLGPGLPETRIFVSGGTADAYLDTGLTNGVYYYYRVAPVEQIGVTGAWAGVAGTPYADPAAPAVLTLAEGDATLTLAWSPAATTTAVFPVTGYRITRATYAGFLDGAGIIVGPDPLYATTYVDTGVVNAVPYWYRVLTWDRGGHLSVARSPEASGTPYARPAAPAWLTITAGNASAWLEWAPAVATTYPVSAYVIYRASFSGAGSCTPCAIATVWGDTASVYLATGLTNGVTVFTAVATRDALGHVGLAGNQAATQPAVAPCPPLTLTARPGTVDIAIQWAPVNGALCGTPSTFPVSGYRVLRATAPGGPASWLADLAGATVTVYTDSSPVPGTTYYYRVHAYDTRVPVNAGAASSPEAAGTARTPAGPPLALTVQGEPFEHDGMAKLLWSGATPATLPVVGYNIYRASCSGCAETRVFGPGSAATVSYLDTGISNTVYWEYRVTTVEQGFFEGGSAVVSTTPFADPNPPVALTIREFNGQLTLGWTPAAATSYPVTAYRVSRASYPGTVALAVLADGVYATTYADGSLANGVALWYHLQAYDTKGHLSHAYSAQIGGTPFAAPAAPGNLTAYPGDKRITVSWDPAAAGTYAIGGYAVYRLAGGDPGCAGVPYASVGAAQLQLIDNLAANDGVFYSYRVAAFDAVSAAHLGPCSGLVTSSAYAGIDPPGKPNGLSAVPTPLQVALTWQQSAATTRPVSGYALYRTTFAGNAATPVEWSVSMLGATTTVYVDAAPPTGFVYYYRLRAYDMDSATPVTVAPYVSEASGEVPAFVAAPPQNLTVMALVANQLYVGWDIPPYAGGLPVAGYRIQRSTGADGPYELAGSAGTVTSFDDAGVTRGLTTWYRVEAVHQGGWVSALSSTGFATIGGAPSAPVVSAVADDGSVTVDWTPSTGEFPPITYAILRGTFAGFPGDGTAYDTPVVPPYSYTDLGVVNGTPYYYRVLAVDSGDVSATSVQEPFALPLAQPQTLTCVPGDSRITLGWDPSPNGLAGVSGYLVYRRTLVSAEGVAATIFGASATSYLDLAVANGVMYYYRVRAFDSITPPTNHGPFSVETQGRPVTVPGPVTIAQIWPSYGAVDLCWTGPVPAGTNPTAGYRVWRSSNGGPFDLVATVGTVTCYSDTGLQNGVDWGFQVAAIDNASPPFEGTRSNTVTAKPFDVPAPPTTLTTFAASGQLLVGWAAAVPTTWPVAGYQVYRGTVADGESPVPVNGALVTGTSFLNTGLVNGTRYFFKIRAQDTQGRLSATSAEVSGIPFTAPVAPALSGAPADRQVDLAWTSSSGTYTPVTGYAVYRGTYAGFAVGVPELVTSTLAYTDLTVTNGTPYYYRIGARDSDWVTGPHETLSNERFILPLGIPTSLSALPGDTRVALAWTPSAQGVAGIAGYQVWRWPPATAPSLIATVPVTASVYTDTLAANGVAWAYRLVPVDSLVDPVTAGGLSATVTATPGIPWGAPVLVSVVPSSQRIDVRWSAPTPAQSPPLSAYRLYRSSGAGPFALWRSFAATVTVFADTPVTNGVAWAYFVTALDSRFPPVETPPSNTLGATAFEPPFPPGNLTVLVRNGAVYIGWASVYGSSGTIYVQTSYPPSGFVLSWATAPLQPGTTFPVVITGTSYVHTGATNGTTYWYKLRTVDTSGNYSATSYEVFGTPFAPPAPPAVLSALPMNLAVRLNWTTPFQVSAVSGPPWSGTFWVGAGTYAPVSGYMIYRGLAPGAGTPLAGPVYATTYLDAAVANGTAYFYTVRARNARGDEGEPSPEATATPAATIVNPPMVVGVIDYGTSVALSWSLTVAGAPPTDQYVIVRSSCAACGFTSIPLGGTPYVSSTVFSYTDPTVIAGGYWRYAVRSVVLAPYAESLDYPWAVVTILSSCAVPGSPAPVVATAGSGIATVTWAASTKGCPADTVTYRVERRANGGAWTVLVAATTALSYYDTGLVNGTAYEWQVTPSGTGGTGAAAASAAVTPVARPNSAWLSANAFAPVRGDRLYLTFTLATEAVPSLKIYTLSGMKVVEVANPGLPAGPPSGSYTFLGADGLPGWSGQSEDGRFVASGVYLLEFSAGTFRKSLKVVVIK